MSDLFLVTGSDEVIREGTAVVLPDDPTQRWIVHVGWYNLQLPGSYTMNEGWYITRVSDGFIVPIDNEVLEELVVLCDGHIPHCICYPTPVTPGPGVPYPEYVGGVLRTIQGIIATNAGVEQIYTDPILNPPGCNVGDILVGSNACIAVVTSIEAGDDIEMMIRMTSTGTMLSRSDTCEAQCNP